MKPLVYTFGKQERLLFYFETLELIGVFSMLCGKYNTYCF